jgi:hypothetical protein
MKEASKKYIPDFKKEVTKRTEEIDPNSELDWLSLTVGWAIAKGMTPFDAKEFAIYLRYHTSLT